MKWGNTIPLGLFTGLVSRAVRPDSPDSRRTTPKNAEAKANPPGDGGECVNGLKELSHGAGS